MSSRSSLDDASLIRLVSMLAIEADDEWPVGRGSSDSPCRRCSNSERPGTLDPLAEVFSGNSVTSTSSALTAARNRVRSRGSGPDLEGGTPAWRSPDHQPVRRAQTPRQCQPAGTARVRCLPASIALTGGRCRFCSSASSARASCSGRLPVSRTACSSIPRSARSSPA